MSSAIPKSWVEVELAQHVYLAGRIGWRGLKADEYTQTGPILLSVPNLNCGDEVDFAKVNHISQARYDESPEIQLNVGDALLVKDGAGIGKLGYVAQLPSPSTVNSSLLVVRPNDELLASKYLFYYFKGPKFQQIARERITGSATPHLFQKDIKRFNVLVPPKGEQRRIVAKLEKLLGQVDTCQQRLARIPTLLKRFRQSVLAAACSGRLTADWRDENPGDETRLGVLVELIRRRRETDAKTPAQHEKLREIYDQEEKNDSGTLPLGWGFVTLAKLCGSFDYGTSTKSQPTGKVPVLRMGNIQNGKLYWDDLVYTSDHTEIDDYRLQPKTVLFNRTNSPELVGKTAIYLGERPAIFAGYLIRVNQCPELDPEYLNFCLNTSYAHEFCQSVKTDGVSQSNINAQKLGRFEVPFCSLPEQQEIVRRVKSLFTLADRIESRFAEGRRRVNGITQAILAKAFRGELVPTEFELAKAEARSFESAEELLKRIGHNGQSEYEKAAANRARRKLVRTNSKNTK
jgi:type I restriction enzyme S subunit